MARSIIIDADIIVTDVCCYNYCCLVHSELLSIMSTVVIPILVQLLSLLMFVMMLAPSLLLFCYCFFIMTDFVVDDKPIIIAVVLFSIVFDNIINVDDTYIIKSVMNILNIFSRYH